ncbi:MAG: phosphatase PAP2 family protein [bacterium]|nr:phosphatase PAP2 family protein [bacterium]
MNTAIFQYLHGFAGQSVGFNTIIIFCAKYLPYIIVAVLGLFFIFGHDRRRELKMIIYAAISVILSRLVITEIIRYFYPVARPFIFYKFTPLLYDSASSFPSGHAAFFFALAAIIFIFHKKWGIVYFLGSLIICVSRIMAGIHWPADILGGVVVGIGSAILIYYWLRPRFEAKRQIAVAKQ